MKTESYSVDGEGSELHFAEDVLISLKSLQSFSKTLLERLSRVKPKERFRPRDIQTAARLSIG